MAVASEKKMFCVIVCAHEFVSFGRVVFVTPVISPCCGVKGTWKLTGRKRGSTVSRGTTGSFVACQ